MDMDTGSILYETVAHEISAMITTGTLRPGDRLPSVRRLSRQRKVSISTVLLSYELLERRGMVEARPQSGYYVRLRPQPVKEPAVSRPPRTPQLVGVHRLVQRVMEDAQRPGLVQFGAALPDASVVPSKKIHRIIASVLRADPRLVATYSLPPGRIELRRQIALRVQDWGVRISADDLVITHGCMEAVNLCLRAVAKPGDVIAMESPTYFGLLQVIESMGLKALEIPTDPRTGISLEALELAIERENVKACLLMPTVSNPLGSTMPEVAKKRLVKMLAEHDIPLIEDAVYASLHYGATPPYAAKAYDRKGNVMLCSSFTKTLVPGFRVGWVAAGKYHEQVQMATFINSIGVSDFLQLTLAELLEQSAYDRFLRGIRRNYVAQIERMKHAIAEHFPAGTRVTSPTGGYVLWVQMPQAVDASALYELCLKQGVSFAPGQIFSASDRYQNCLRLNCGLPWSPAVKDALAKMGTGAARLAAG
jgi:DNA-binding transcriptional MocR family regulator